MASVEQLPSGRYRGIWREGGKKRYTKPYERKTDAREDAQEQEVKARRRVAANAGRLSARIKWGEWCEIWWPDRDLEADTEYNERGILNNYLLPQWETTPLNEIGKVATQKWVNSLARKKSPGYTRRIFAVFRASITSALEDEILLASPLVNIKLPKVPQTSRRHFEKEELDTLKQHLLPRFQQIVDFLSETGLRPGELAGAHRNRIRGGWLTVAEVLVSNGKLIKIIPKDEDQRDIPLTSQALKILEIWDSELPRRAGCGVPHSDDKPCLSDLIVRGHTGSALGLISFRNALNLGLHKAGISHGSPYSLRHTFGSRLAEAGVDAFEIARLMGHSKPETTQNYVHRTTSARNRVLAALGDPAATQVRAVSHGTEHGTDHADQALRSPTSEQYRKPA